MNKIVLSFFLLLFYINLFSATIPVTPDTYVAEYTNAKNGDILLLDAGTYSTALAFPSGKTITLKKSSTATTKPVLTFSWNTTEVPVAGSGLILEGLEIDLNADYYINFPESSKMNKLIFTDCIIANVKRCLVRASNNGIETEELTIENCIIKDCGSNGYCLNWHRGILNKMTVKNSTLYNYGGEGLFLANTNAQTHAFSFKMENNTVYQSGKDGSANYAWCSILIGYGAESTYSISNNIICKPFTTAAQRLTIVVPAGSGTVTCKNNLVIDYPNFSVAPAAGWEYANNTESTSNVFKDPANQDFTLDASFSYKGSDGNLIGDPRWWPKQGSNSELNGQQIVKAVYAKGFIHYHTPEVVSSIEVFTLNGKRMGKQIANEAKGQIDVSNFCKGIYIMKFNSKGKIQTQKVSVF
jgi:hypothetical protein